MIDNASKGEYTVYKDNTPSKGKFYDGQYGKIDQDVGRVNYETSTDESVEALNGMRASRVSTAKEDANNILSLTNKANSGEKLSKEEEVSLRNSKIGLARAMYDIEAGPSAQGLDETAINALKEIVAAYETILQSGAKMTMQLQEYSTLCETVVSLEQQIALIKKKAGDEGREMTKEEADAVGRAQREIDRANEKKRKMEEDAGEDSNTYETFKGIEGEYAVNSMFAKANIEAGSSSGDTKADVREADKLAK
jgi:hypothetical protein